MSHVNCLSTTSQMMFWADNFTNSEYIGFCDSDTLFNTYVDRLDIFSTTSMPVVNGLVSQIHYSIYFQNYKSFFEVKDTKKSPQLGGRHNEGSKA